MNAVQREARSALRFAVIYLVMDLVLFGAASVIFIVYLDKVYLAAIALALCFVILAFCVYEVYFSCYRCVCKCGVAESKRSIKLTAYFKKYYFEKQDCVSLAERKKYYTLKIKPGRFARKYYFYKQVKGETAFTRGQLERLTGLKFPADTKRK